MRCQHRDQGRLAIANKFREAPPLTSKHFGRDPLREEPVLVGRVLARIEHAPAARVIYALRHERQHAAEGLDRMVVLCHTRVSLWPFTQRDHEEQLFHILWWFAVISAAATPVALIWNAIHEDLFGRLETRLGGAAVIHTVFLLGISVCLGAVLQGHRRVLSSLAALAHLLWFIASGARAGLISLGVFLLLMALPPSSTR